MLPLVHFSDPFWPQSGQPQNTLPSLLATPEMRFSASLPQRQMGSPSADQVPRKATRLTAILSDAGNLSQEANRFRVGKSVVASERGRRK